MWNYPPAEILVAVDFGEASARAVSVAGVLGRRYDARVLALHAETLEAPPYFTHDQIRDMERQRRSARAEAQRYLAKFVREHTSYRLTARLTDGPPATAIVQAGRTKDLIVTGTHGRRGPSRWWLGSVAERIIQASTSPVLVVRAPQLESPAEAIFERPMALITRSGFDDDAHRYALGLAETFAGRAIKRDATRIKETALDEAATMLVVAMSEHHGRGWFAESTEHLLRLCTLPLLFLPSLRGSP